MTATNVSSAGLYVQPLAETITDMQTAVQGVYGADVNVSLATPDGQLIKAVATAINDQANLLQVVYNAIDVRKATGAALSGRLRLNGLERSAGTFSVCTLQCNGTAGTVLPVGLAIKVDNTVTWTLASEVTIPSGGTVLGTFRADIVGANVITSGSSLVITTPVYGLQVVRPPASPITTVTLGTAYEQDPEAQARRARSVALPAKSIVAATLAQVLAVDGCLQAAVYENTSALPVAYGGTSVPGHSVLVVAFPGIGGITPPFEAAVAQAITRTIAPGCGTAGYRTVTLQDAAGIDYDIHWMDPSQVDLLFTVTVKTLSGWVDSVHKPAVQQAIVTAVNSGLYDSNGKLILPRIDIGGAVAPTDFAVAVLTVPFCRVSEIAVTVHYGSIVAGEEALMPDEIAVCSALSRVTVVTV